MTPELSKRLAKIANTLHLILSQDDYVVMMQAAEVAKVYSNLSDWYRYLIEWTEAWQNQ